MGLYDFKEFLTFDDVVEYLIDLNIYDRNISKDYLGKKTRDNLLQFVKEEKINPIVYCHSVFFARAISYNTSCYKIESGYYDGYMFLDKYACIDILNIGYMDGEEYNLEHTTYNGEKTETEVFLGFHFKPALTINSSFDEFIAENKQLFIEFIPIALDKNKTIRYTDFLYLKSELDAIFNPNQTTNTETTTLQNQLDQAHARIAELENQSGNKELPKRTANNASKIILAMAELLKWDLSKPFADETNGKIREVLGKQNNQLSKDTVADWLKQAYDIGK